MSRKNNKSIKKRYNNYLKTVERQQEVKKEEREKNKEERRQEEEAEELLEDMVIDDVKPEKMDVEKRKKIKKKLKAIKPKKGEKKRRIKWYTHIPPTYINSYLYMPTQMLTQIYLIHTMSP